MGGHYSRLGKVLKEQTGTRFVCTVGVSRASPQSPRRFLGSDRSVFDPMDIPDDPVVSYEQTT